MSDKETYPRQRVDAYVVCDMRVLKAMERRGFITLHHQTGEKVGHWTGMTCRAWYVDGPGPDVHPYKPFEYKGVQYELRYFDGCFHQFVCRKGAIPAHVKPIA